MPRSLLTDADLKTYRHQLEQLVHRIGGQMDSLRREALSPVGAESSSVGGNANVQQSDLGNQDAEEFRAFGVLESEEHLLAEATAALLRIKDGAYGRCVSCGKSIPRARLDAVPYAQRCVPCEQIREAEEKV